MFVGFFAIRRSAGGYIFLIPRAVFPIFRRLIANVIGRFFYEWDSEMSLNVLH